MGRIRRVGAHTNRSTHTSGVRLAEPAPVTSASPSSVPPVPGHTAFVGRELEVQRALDHVLGGAAGVVWVHGAGGIGKTTLAREVERRVRELGRATVFLRMERVEARPAAVIEACAERLARGARELGGLLEHNPGALILLDGLEVASSLEGWLVDQLAGCSTHGATLMITSRDAPSREWRAPATAGRLVTLPLHEWNAEESASYLATRSVPRARWAKLLAATRGHPLALALAAEDPERASAASAGAPSPEVVQTLLDGLLERTLSASQRHALEALSLVPCLTQSLLEHMLELSDGFEAFRWLSQRPYVRATRDGLVLHDLVRDAMAADLRWRASPRADALSTRAVEFHANALEVAGSVAGASHGRSLAWLFCQRPSIRSTFTRAAQDLYFDDMRAADEAWVGALVARADGPSARACWAALHRFQPSATVVARDARRRPRGVWMELTLEPGAALPVADDPALRVVAADMQALQLAAPQRASLQRVQLDEETLREVGPTIELRVAHDARVMLTTLGLAARYITAPTGFRWARVWESRGYRALDESFLVGEKSFTVWRLDLRGTRAAEYVRAAFVGAGAVAHPAPTVGDRAQPAPAAGDRAHPAPAAGDRAQPTPAANAHPAGDVSAMRAALGAVGDPTAFARCALSARLGHAAEPAARLATFRAWLETELTALGASRAGQKWSTALRATYLTPASTQEEVAEALDLPFRTYRDHLTRGVAELARRFEESINGPS